jgi:flagellar hook-associated protein 3 FlgL
MVMNFLARLSNLDRQITLLQSKITTGNTFNTPGENPAGASQVMTVETTLQYLLHYRDSMNDGKSRLSFVDENLSNVGDYLQRARELAVQGANTYLTDLDRSALVSEINQIIHGVGTLANADYNARFIYAGYQTLTRPFEISVASDKVSPLDVLYKGDPGVIARNINSGVDIDINFSGKALFLDQTETLIGRAIGGDPLGYSGFFRINGQTISVYQTDTLMDIRDRINATKNVGVVAKVDPNFVLSLESISAVGEIRLEETGGTILKDLGITLAGAHNIGLAAPTLPLIDSQGAIKTGAVLAQYPSPPGLGVTIDDTNNRLVIRLGGNANNGDIVRVPVELRQGNYATITDLISMVQERIDAEMGEKKVFVRENAGAIELETYVSGSTVTVNDLVVGGFDNDGKFDTASQLLGLTVAGGPEAADTAGTDGNDKFYIDLGPSAHPDGRDLDPVLIDIDADASLTLADLIDSINAGIRESELNGLVEVRDHLGRLEFYTLLDGKSVLGTDLQFSDATAGTLSALSIVNAQTPARVVGTAPFPPGITITAGVDDSFTIDLGPSAMLDYSNPQPQTLTITAGAYATAASLAAAINSEILANSTLNGNVEAAVMTILGVDYVEIRTLATGSDVDTGDLILADVLPGTLANMGLNGATVPGGGSTDGQGEKVDADNIFASLINLRDNLLGIAGKESRLVKLNNFDTGEFLGLVPGDTIEITANGNTRKIHVHTYTTLDHLAREISDFLGIGVEVYLTGEGRIYLENISNQPVNDLSVKAYDELGRSRSEFNKAFASFSGTMLPKSTAYSAKLKDESKFLAVSDVSLGEVDRNWTHALDYRSRAGSAVRRLELALTQSDGFEVQLRERKELIQGADMSMLITEMKSKENILRAILSMGENVFPPSLFEFLR